MDAGTHTLNFTSLPTPLAEANFSEAGSFRPKMPRLSSMVTCPLGSIWLQAFAVLYDRYLVQGRYCVQVSNHSDRDPDGRGGS